MDAAGGNTRAAQCLVHLLGEAGRPAHEDVVLVDVRQLPAQALRRDVGALARRGCSPRTSAGRRARWRWSQLVPQGQVLGAVGPVEQGDVAGRAGQRLEQRPHRGDADAARHQQHLAPAARAAVSAPYGPSAHTRVPGSSSRSGALWSPIAFTVIRSMSGRGAADSEYGWELNRMPGGQEAPAEELPRLRAHPVQLRGP